MIEFGWKPDKQDKKPVYRQIVEYVSGKVASGDWVIGSRLPSQRAMAEAFDVNRSTIVAAMEELISYGILESGFGSGTRVASNTWSLLMSQPPIGTNTFRAVRLRPTFLPSKPSTDLSLNRGTFVSGQGSFLPIFIPINW
ncbi:MAG: GntR family transcriptional regulator [Emergencia sp.]